MRRFLTAAEHLFRGGNPLGPQLTPIPQSDAAAVGHVGTPGRGELPFPVHRVGRQWVVPTAGLLAFLGLSPQDSCGPVTPDTGSSARG